MDLLAQDLGVTYRRMTDLTRRSEQKRRLKVARTERHAEPVALRDTSELVNVVSLRLTEPECCSDEQVAS